MKFRLLLFILITTIFILVITVFDKSFAQQGGGPGVFNANSFLSRIFQSKSSRPTSATNQQSVVREPVVGSSVMLGRRTAKQCCICLYDGSYNSEAICKKAIENSGCEDPLIAQVDDSDTINDWFRRYNNQCLAVNFIYRGHGRGLWGVNTFLNQVRTIINNNGTTINMDIGGCSTVQDYQVTKKYMQEVVKILPQNVQINFVMNQAQSDCDETIRTPINFSVSSQGVRTMYPSCDNVVDNFCYKFGEQARCRDEEGVLRYNVCCPGVPYPSRYRFFGFLFSSQPDRGSWKEKDSETNFCPGYRRANGGICRASSEEKIKECLKGASDGCKSNDGVFVENDISWGPGYIDASWSCYLSV